MRRLNKWQWNNVKNLSIIYWFLCLWPWNPFWILHTIKSWHNLANMRLINWLIRNFSSVKWSLWIMRNLLYHIAQVGIYKYLLEVPSHVKGKFSSTSYSQLGLPISSYNSISRALHITWSLELSIQLRPLSTQCHDGFRMTWPTIIASGLIGTFSPQVIQCNHGHWCLDKGLKLDFILSLVCVSKYARIQRHTHGVPNDLRSIKY